MIRLTIGCGDASSFRLIFALEELGLGYALQKIDLHALEQWTDSHRAVSPTGAVPLLQAGNLFLEESDLALFFLAESNPEGRLIPTEAAALYDCQNTISTLDHLMNDSGNLLSWIAATVEDSRKEYLSRLEAIHGRPILSGWSAVLRDAVPRDRRPQAALENLQEGLALVEGLLAGSEWLLGNDFSIADIAGVSLIHRLPCELRSDAALSSRPAIGAWLGRITGRPAYQKAIDRLVYEGIGAFHSPPRDHE